MTDLQYFLNEQSELQRKMPKDMMQDWLDSQSELQYKMPSAHPTELYLRSRGMPPVEGPDHWVPADDDRMPAIDFIHWNVTALVDELHELLGEIGWKPWAKSRHINLEAARGEFIDALHFMGNLALVLGLDDAKEIISRYHAKHAKNAKRQEEGYDGVSTKCPGCKRALDDDAVECTQTGQLWGSGVAIYHCVVNNTDYSVEGRTIA